MNLVWDNVSFLYVSNVIPCGRATYWQNCVSSSLQYNNLRSFCLVLLFWRPVSYTAFYFYVIIFLLRKKFFWRINMCKRRRHIVLETKTKVSAQNIFFLKQMLYKTPQELFWNNNDVGGKKESIGLVGSTIRERDKKNVNYYVGDYSSQWRN